MTSVDLALVCMLAPLAGFFVALVGFRNQHKVAAAIVLLAGLTSAVSSLVLLGRGAPDQPLHTWPWLTIGNTTVDFGVLVDGRALIMGAVVGVITLCIQVYSLSYMSKDPGRGRFFAFLALFEWAMLSFVYSPNLLQTFIFWELVGLASFLLIGFWYNKPSAVAASKKAFLMTRIGDVGLFIGLILLFQEVGTLDIAYITSVFGAEGLPEGVSDGRVELIAGLLFLGIVGKSAQFPLHTWLPDAMEGPTPVSALLHSATMVAAGVFLFARFHELFMDAETVLTIVLVIATFTAVLASTMAMVAKDMKRVLAYSSISQLGFMLIALGAGNLFAGVFHLTTHAAFKALLFLTAGAYIHHYGTNDMIAIGRAGGRKMKVTTLALVVGGAALAGIPPLAGFWSKELILGSLTGAGNTAFLVGAYTASFLTAYYTFRMIFLVVRPNESSAAVPDEPAGAQHHGDDDHDDGHHGDAAPWLMRAPILLLTVAAAGIGFAGDYIADVMRITDVHHPGIGEMAPAIGVALLGVAVAWLDFGRSSAAQTGFVSRAPALEKLFANRWYIDHIYKKVFVGGAVGFARLMYTAETKGFDGAGDLVGEGTVDTADAVARTQTGRLQFYIGTAIAVVAFISLYLGLR
jgi:NADH-quinone oxidoreductase subunit L